MHNCACEARPRSYINTKQSATFLVAAKEAYHLKSNSQFTHHNKSNIDNLSSFSFFFFFIFFLLECCIQVKKDMLLTVSIGATMKIYEQHDVLATLSAGLSRTIPGAFCTGCTRGNLFAASKNKESKSTLVFPHPFAFWVCLCRGWGWGLL